MLGERINNIADDGVSFFDSCGYRYFHVIVGSMLMGFAGFYLIMVYSPNWIEGMTAGRGWIAIALIIFARWNPLYALLGAYFFGGMLW